MERALKRRMKAVARGLKQQIKATEIAQKNRPILDAIDGLRQATLQDKRTRMKEGIKSLADLVCAKPKKAKTTAKPKTKVKKIKQRYLQ